MCVCVCIVVYVCVCMNSCVYVCMCVCMQVSVYAHRNKREREKVDESQFFGAPRQTIFHCGLVTWQQPISRVHSQLEWLRLRRGERGQNNPIWRNTESAHINGFWPLCYICSL
ncbi:hypothetical protein XELAEV_18000891mg [Xenopus laevis]|nr:hypothetical protein XELAEV_18000891mg [Xenopus laevis]